VGISRGVPQHRKAARVFSVRGRCRPDHRWMHVR
jgi:hypothetical protein